MAYSPHVLVSFGGDINEPSAGAEIWNCNIRCDHIGSAPTHAELVTLAAEIGTALGAWFNLVASNTAVNADIRYCKVNNIGADGKYVDPLNPVTFDLVAPITGQGAPTNPPIMSIVTSWLTDQKRGPGSRGRIYLPNWTLGTVSGITINDADQGKVNAAGIALLHVIENIPGSRQLIPVVASSVNAALNPITAVACGNVKDVQRRRKDALVETYKVAAFVP